MNKEYDIIYTGKTLPDFDLEKVIHDFSKITKLDVQKSKKFIDRSSPVYFKRNMTKDSAIKYKSVLEKTGLIVEVRQSKVSTNTSTTNTIKNKEIEYGIIDKIKSLLYRIEITRRSRLYFSLTVTVLTIVTLISVRLLGGYSINFEQLILPLFAAGIGLTLLLYILTGIFQINQTHHRYRLLIIMLIFLAFNLFRHGNNAKGYIITLVALSAMTLVYRGVLYLKGE